MAVTVTMTMAAASVYAAQATGSSEASGTSVNVWPNMLPAVIPLAVPILLAVVKNLVSAIPKWLLPILAPVLGAVAEIGLNYAGAPAVGVMWGAALGSAGVGLREIVDQLKKGGAGGATASLLALGTLVGLTSGCASTGGLFSAKNPAPPTKLEAKLFTIVTNVVERVETKTNLVTVTVPQVEVVNVTITNRENVLVPVQVMQTNLVTVTQTNLVSVTNQDQSYALSGGKGSTAISAGGAVLATPFGWGGVVGTALTGLFAAYMGLRNRAWQKKASTWEQVAGVLGDNIETLRKVIETTPQGQQLGVLCKQYLQVHQAEAGVAQQVAQIVANVVDTDSATKAMQEMQKLLGAVQGVATPVQAVAAAPVQGGAEGDEPDACACGLPELRSPGVVSGW